MQIIAVVALGLVEGTSRVNWRKVAHILGWWLGTLVPLYLVTAALFAQGDLGSIIPICFADMLI